MVARHKDDIFSHLIIHFQCFIYRQNSFLLSGNLEAWRTGFAAKYFDELQTPLSITSECGVRLDFPMHYFYGKHVL